MTPASATAPLRSAPWSPAAGDDPRALRALWPIVPLLAAGVAYAPIVFSYFREDDFLLLYQLRNETLFDFLTMPHGGHLYLTRNALWALFSLLCGTSAARYFAAVLALHLLNVYLLFRVIRHVTGSGRLACLGATLWGVAPANEGTLDWLSVYGHALVATALLLLLEQLVRVAEGRPASRATAALWMGLLFVAGTSFGVGLAIAAAFPLAVWIALPASPTRTRLVLASAAAAALLPLLYVAVTRLHPSFIASGLPLVVGESWPNVLRFLGHLVIAGIAGLLAGPAFDWTSYPMPFAYVLAALFVAGMGWAFWTADARSRRLIAICALLVVAGYASIAAGRVRALNAGGVKPLQVLRYHYVAPALVTVVFTIILAQVERSGRLPLPPAVKNGLLFMALALIGGLRAAFGTPIEHYLLARIDTDVVLTTMRDQIAAAPAGGEVYIPNQDFAPVGPIIRKTPSIFPGWAAVFVIFFPENVVDGRRVFFVEDRLRIHFRAGAGRRTADLFVTSDAARRAAPAPASPEADD